MLGTLYVVGTPIGNLEDMTPRAVQTLRDVAVVAAEDTRHTRKLFTHFDIHTPMISYHEHNIRTVGPLIVQRLLAGEDVGLVTDAGMPGISDPGEDVVRLAVESGCKVSVVPGPTAFAAALVMSGLRTDRFLFLGFLPVKKKDRKSDLEIIAREVRTCILYESPHRLRETLSELVETLGTRRIAVVREITKLHEEVIRGSAATVAAHFERVSPRGEFVLVIEGASPEPVSPQEVTSEGIRHLVEAAIARGMDKKAAMKEIAVRLNLSKRDVYQALLEVKEEEEE